MKISRHPFLFGVTLLLPFLCQAPSDSTAGTSSVPIEFAEPDSISTLEGDVFPGIDGLEAQLGLGVRYTWFTSEDMQEVYGGIPVVELGFTARISRYSYLFTSLGYGWANGDPFDGALDLADEDMAGIRTIPFQMGLKVDLSRNSRLHVYAGFAFEIAWMEEELPTLDDQSRLTTEPASGTNTGYALTFGPEFLLGEKGNVLGLELGWGGAKGAVSTEDHSHDLDLTGLRGRVYFALALRGGRP